MQPSPNPYADMRVDRGRDRLLSRNELYNGLNDMSPNKDYQHTPMLRNHHIMRARAQINIELPRNRDAIRSSPFLHQQHAPEHNFGDNGFGGEDHSTGQGNNLNDMLGGTEECSRNLLFSANNIH